VTVVRDIDIAVEPGRIRAVIGENGAGKSTLMKMLTGIVQPSRGEILVDGNPVQLPTPRSAMDAGIGIVHQELQIVPMLSVADNLMLVGADSAPSTYRGSPAEGAYVRKQLERVGLDVSPRTLAARLSAAEAQLLEIAKALALDSKVLIFDEPTSALPPNDVERLLCLVEELRAEGHAILYISHHLNEIKRIADDVTVLRDGKLVGHYLCADLGTEDMIHLMVDRPVSLYGNMLPKPTETPVLEVRNLSSAHVTKVDFTLNKGEIIGFAGLIGSGMHDAAQALVGGQKQLSGSIRVNGKAVRINSPAQAAAAGIVIVPEERKVQAILPDMSVQENFHIGRHGLFRKGALLSPASMKKRAEDLVRQFKVRLAGLAQPISTLSGGNQQKVVVARCVQSNPDVLILSEPTRGVDVGAKDDIHQLVLDLAESGKSVIVISSEMDEVLALSHRVAVFSGGEMVGILHHADADPKTVMKLATPKTKDASDDRAA
jgi:ribose transport system ATP-binding protein